MRVFNNFFFRLCPADGGMPRDLDLRKLQAFGSDILDIQAQAPERVYVALNDCKIMVLDRLLVKHVLRCTQPILQSVSGVALHRQKLFLLPHESCVRCLARCSRPRVLLSPSRAAALTRRFQCVGRRPLAALRNAAP